MFSTFAERDLNVSRKYVTGIKLEHNMHACIISNRPPSPPPPQRMDQAEKTNAIIPHVTSGRFKTFKHG